MRVTGFAAIHQLPKKKYLWKIKNVLIEIGILVNIAKSINQQDASYVNVECDSMPLNGRSIQYGGARLL